MSYLENETIEKNNVVFDFLKGLIVSMTISFGLVLAFAFSLRWWQVNESMIMPMNLLIKMVSVIFGAMVAIKGDRAGLVKGLVFGLLYMSVAFISFSFLANTFVLDLSFFLDLVCSAVAGAIVGIIKVNRK